MEEFGKNLTRLREGKNFTQEELAKAIEVSRQQVSKWESGKSFPRVKMMRKLAEALKCQVSELTTGKPVTPVPRLWPDEVYVPVVGKIAATPFRLADRNAATRYVAGTRADLNSFALEISGNSMSPRYENGDVVFIKPEYVELTPYQADADDGAPFVPYERVAHLNEKDCVILHNGESSLKRLRITRGRALSYDVDIVSLNKDYNDIHVSYGHEFYVQGVCYKKEKEL